MPIQTNVPYAPRKCAGTSEHGCEAVLAGEHRLRVRCHRCAIEYGNERRRARRAGLPFGIPKEQLPLPDFTPGEQGEQARFS